MIFRLMGSSKTGSRTAAVSPNSATITDMAACVYVRQGYKVTKTAVCVFWVLIGKLKDGVTLPPLHLYAAR